MKIAVPIEIAEGERRVALVPESAKKLIKAGAAVAVQAGAGQNALIADREFTDAGATISSDLDQLLADADIVLKVQPPAERKDLARHEVELLKSGAILVCTLRPTINFDLVKRLVERKVTAFGMDCVPRTTRAQSMDILSSQANIAGYKAVLLAAAELAKYFPMLMTAAGTVLPAKVFVIGAGVAGLQAIATAKRLGATVEGTDTRPVVKEQIESLGARYVGVDTTEQAQDAGGYAKQLSQDFYRKQAELVAKHCASADVVITTALIGGITAPKLITEDMVKGMKAGSVIVDVAAEGGGNCTLTEPGRNVVRHGVTIMGPTNLPSTVATHASLLFSRNVTDFVNLFVKAGQINLDWNDDILKGAIVTHDGEIQHGPTRDAMQKASGGGA
ncbi:MAG: Re/Si-specific NAD(P)(+) transhydrogenase subunit alpha [Planctomycetes bacterium]|nr:Re/Si-specific NAD(P)(+) transhydrogenase subunit alpha [Planctomycetota bacterium]MBI3834738.1 Re/Si-specific NAD(P)(+) transhydrogenase subunit alpha [Planctomycetota bacterium]